MICPENPLGTACGGCSWIFSRRANEQGHGGIRRARSGRETSMPPGEGGQAAAPEEGGQANAWREREQAAVWREKLPALGGLLQDSRGQSRAAGGTRLYGWCIHNIRRRVCEG